MAKINKNGSLSGSIKNLVFVNNGEIQYVRSKPTKVKQSSNTKKAAKTFGLISTTDKIYRELIQNHFKINTDSRYAARHRAALSRTYNNFNTATPCFDTPKALEGFCFNKNMPWENTVRIHLEIKQHTKETITVKIPTITLGKNIIVEKKPNKTAIIYYAYTIDINNEQLTINKIDELEFIVKPKEIITPEDWILNCAHQKGWLIILGTITLIHNDSTIGTSSYTNVINLSNE